MLTTIAITAAVTLLWLVVRTMDALVEVSAKLDRVLQMIQER